MRAAVLTEDRPRLDLADLPDPSPGPGEVLVRVSGCGICGSDLHVSSTVAPPGSVLGHEIAGTVEEVGAGVEGWSPGVAVTARPFFGCGTCRFCRAGRADHCPDFALVGHHRWGGFAEAAVLSAAELFALPGALGPVERVLVEPLAVARRALRRGGLTPGEDVLVLGGGPIGLAVVHWARALGAGRIVVSEPVDARRRLALELGADIAIEPSGAAEMAGAPLVVECSGRAGLIDTGLQLADVEGRVCVVGICSTQDTIFPWWGLSKELDLRFAIYYGREDFLETIDALDGGVLNPGAMVVEQIGIEDLPARFHELAREPGDGKVVVVP